MNTISREQLLDRIEHGGPVQLVMALGRWHYDRLHIPGSKTIADVAAMNVDLPADQEIIVYCTNPACPASYRVYYLLKSLGYQKVVRYAGGIEDWMEAGFPIEGSLVGETEWASA